MNQTSTRTAFVFALASAFCLIASASAANSRDTTLELLDALLTERGDESVRVFVNEGKGTPIRIGEKLVYRFESAGSGYLTAIHVDTQGAATLFYPRVDLEAGRVHAGQAVQLPAIDDGFHLAVQPPVGRDLVYAIVTDFPISRSDLGIDSRDIVVSFEAQQAPAFVRRLSSLLESRAKSEVHVAQVEQQVDGRGAVQYRSADIVGFFGERTRSIRPAKLDLQIRFSTNSSALDAAARQNIDEFARALSNPKLREMRFKVAGHTDSMGSEQHNIGLSGQRADVVRNYLIEVGGIEAMRLESEALGESIPLLRNDSDYARQMNRRVEFTPLR